MSNENDGTFGFPFPHPGRPDNAMPNDEVHSTDVSERGKMMLTTREDALNYICTQTGIDRCLISNWSEVRISNEIKFINELIAYKNRENLDVKQ